MFRKKDGVYLRPRVKRTVPLMDVAMAVVIGTVSGIYIFNDTFRRFQETEQEIAAGKPNIPQTIPNTTEKPTQ